MDNITTERWKTIDEFPLYEVSTHGRLRSWNAGARRGPAGDGRRAEPLMMRSHPTRGYATTSFWNGATGLMIHRRVHHIVLEAFVGPKPDPGMVCRHLDGNFENNRLENLKWGIPSENSADTRRHRGVSDDEKLAAVIMHARGVPLRVISAALGYAESSVHTWTVDLAPRMRELRAEWAAEAGIEKLGTFDAIKARGQAQAQARAKKAPTVPREAAGRGRLTVGVAREILARRAAGAKRGALASEFGFSVATIASLFSRRIPALRQINDEVLAAEAAFRTARDGGDS